MSLADHQRAVAALRSVAASAAQAADTLPVIEDADAYLPLLSDAMMGKPPMFDLTMTTVGNHDYSAQIAQFIEIAGQLAADGKCAPIRPEDASDLTRISADCNAASPLFAALGQKARDVLANTPGLKAALDAMGKQE